MCEQRYTCLIFRFHAQKVAVKHLGDRSAMQPVAYGVGYDPLFIEKNLTKLGRFYSVCQQI